jgi:hypothetical protein
MSSLLKPDDLKKITEDAEMAKLREALDKRKKSQDAEHDFKAAFMEQDVHPDVAERVMSVVRRAAENGQRELLVMRFPAAFCNDHGRRINNYAPDWPDSLEGFAKRAMHWYRANLQPLGYKTRAEIMSYPGGELGEVGIYLSW